jgi:hypothetical protein
MGSAPVWLVISQQQINAWIAGKEAWAVSCAPTTMERKAPLHTILLSLHAHNVIILSTIFSPQRPALSAHCLNAKVA